MGPRVSRFVEPPKDKRMLAEHSADPDSGDICNICNFPLDHAVKKNKPKTKCPTCHRTVHQPYLKTDPCICSLLG